VKWHKFLPFFVKLDNCAKQNRPNRYLWMQKTSISIIPFPTFWESSNIIVNIYPLFPFLCQKFICFHFKKLYFLKKYRFWNIIVKFRLQDCTDWVLSIYLKKFYQAIAEISIFKEKCDFFLIVGCIFNY